MLKAMCFPCPRVSACDEQVTSGSLVPNAAAGAKSLVGAGRLVEASLQSVRPKLVCSYLGLIWGPCLGGEKGCEYAAAEQQWVVAVTVWLKGHKLLIQGKISCSLCTNETFLFVYKVGDFGDATNWPTPGEIAHKSVQVRKQNCSGEQDMAFADLTVPLEALAEIDNSGS